MVFQLLLYLVLYGIIIFVPGAGVAYLGYRALKPRIDAWKQRRLAEHHAKLLEAHEHQRCFACLEPCTAADCHDRRFGWYHAKCYMALKG